MLSSDWPAGSQASELWSQSRSHTLLKRRLFSAGVTGTQTQQVSKRTHPFLSVPPAILFLYWNILCELLLLNTLYAGIPQDCVLFKYFPWDDLIYIHDFNYNFHASGF